MEPEYENSINFGKLYYAPTITTTTATVGSGSINCITEAVSKMCTVTIKLLPNIKKVIFNKPATIVLWGDNTKTVVKCADGEEYSEEVGLAMCIAEKYCGNYSQFKKAVRKGKAYDNVRKKENGISQ